MSKTRNRRQTAQRSTPRVQKTGARVAERLEAHFTNRGSVIGKSWEFDIVCVETSTDMLAALQHKDNEDFSLFHALRGQVGQTDAFRTEHGYTLIFRRERRG